MAKGIKAVIALFASQGARQVEELTGIRKKLDIDIEFKKEFEPQKSVLDKVNSNHLQKIVYILNQMLKQKVFQDGNETSFYSVVTQLLSGDVTEMESFNNLGVKNKTIIDLTNRLDNLLGEDKDILVFIAKLLSGSFTQDDLELINKYSPLPKEDLNQFSEFFAVRDTDGKLKSLARVMLGIYNGFGNFKSKV